jgi:hypothetical protein
MTTTGGQALQEFATAATARAGQSDGFRALGRPVPWPTGVGVVATTAGPTLLVTLPEPARNWVSAWCVLAAAVNYVCWETARGDLRSPRLLAVQTGAVLAFGAVTIAAVAADPGVARYVLAAGWLAHAASDVVRHRADPVVPRWYSETCLVVDLILATGLVTVGPSTTRIR